MKIKFYCNKCPQINNPNPFFIELPISEDLYYEFVCNKGHNNKYAVRNTKYGLLFESGIYAFIDGYNREAVTGFAVALERFYEYVINFALVYDNGFSFDTLEKFKKDIKLSERLFGAFSTIYLLKFKKVLQIFDNKFLKEIQINIPKFGNEPVKFRNKVTHEGYIPSDKETTDYAIAVSKYIYKISEELIAIDKGAFFNFMMMNVGESKKKSNSDEEVSTFLLPSYLGNPMSFGNILPDFLKHIEYIKQERKKQTTN